MVQYLFLVVTRQVSSFSTLGSTGPRKPATFHACSLQFTEALNACRGSSDCFGKPEDTCSFCLWFLGFPEAEVASVARPQPLTALTVTVPSGLLRGTCLLINTFCKNRDPRSPAAISAEPPTSKPKAVIRTEDSTTTGMLGLGILPKKPGGARCIL